MQSRTAADFPWAGSHPWDVDIAIVGGGPAGLAAAIRLRWLKTMPPLPLSTCLINSGPLGGLACLGNSILTGPGLAFPAAGLVNRLRDDLDRWPLPILNNKVIGVERRHDYFRLQLEDGGSLRAAAVIMACGMLDIRNMARFWRQGVLATFGNRANIFTILHKELPACRQPLVLGGAHLSRLQQTITTLNANATLLVPPSCQGAADTGNLLQGELLELRESAGVLKGALLKTDAGLVEKQVDRVIIEFNSLELGRGLLPSGLPSLENGYLQTTTNCRTTISGLFGAGDCTGPPFAALVAMGQGAEAAFAAYDYVHRMKYNLEPALFAYFGDSRVKDNLAAPDDFPLRAELVPARLLRECPLAGLEDLWHFLDGRTSLGALCQRQGLSEEELFRRINQLVKERALTFCPL